MHRPSESEAQAVVARVRRAFEQRKGGVEDAPVMDSSAFFAMVFGSDKFEHLVGELQVAMMMSMTVENMGNEELEEAA